MPSVALRFRTHAWGTPQAPPSRFALFYYGRNDTTKGPVYLSRQGAEGCVAKWKARRIELAADFEHAVLTPGTEGAPASAWFDLEAAEDALYATNVRWSERARGYFLRGEYRYHSPFVDLEADAQGKQWVVALHNFALTNWPATDRQRPLVARAFSATGRRFTMLEPGKLKEVIEALEKTSLTPKEQSALIGACTSGGAMPVEVPVEEPMADASPAPEEEMPYTDAAASLAPGAPLVASLRTAFGLPADADEKAVLAVASTYAREREANNKRLAALEGDKKKRDAEERSALFSDFRAKGKLRYADEKEARTLLDTAGPAAFRAAYGRVPALEQAAPKQTAALPTAGIPAVFSEAQRRTGAPVVNTETAVPVHDLRAYMDKHNVGPAAAARALRAVGKK